jgi:hypothetical protein
MPDRLLVGALGHRNSGKSHTWNTLFGRTVRRGVYARTLEVRPRESIEVFLVSGSFEEREEYAGDILKNQDCRIVLCSMQYIGDVGNTLGYFTDQGFSLYVQWLNPGFSDQGATFDHLGLVPRILAARSVLAIRNGQLNADSRVQEIREIIYGWARYRNLIVASATT